MTSPNEILCEREVVFWDEYDTVWYQPPVESVNVELYAYAGAIVNRKIRIPAGIVKKLGLLKNLRVILNAIFMNTGLFGFVFCCLRIVMMDIFGFIR